MHLKKTLKQYGITSIWHFTDESNLASIKKHGLLSLHMIDKNNIHVPCYGADILSHTLDKMYGLDKFVHLSIVKSHPMQYIKSKRGEIPNPIWLEIDVSVLFQNHSQCCEQIANASSATCHDIQDLAEVVDLELLLNNHQYNNPVRKAQLLVANKIDYSKIKGVYHG